MNEIFRKQKLLSVNVLRQMFEKLAHSSIMKLNEQSMNKVSLTHSPYASDIMTHMNLMNLILKLFDLMLMVTKYQIVACNTPIDLIQITLNHLNSMTQMARLEKSLQLIEATKERFLETYSKMKLAHLQHIRYTILTFLQDVKTRVSIFLRDGTQENDGKFVIKPEGVVSCECQIPGTIKYFEGNEVTQTESFPSMATYVVSTEKTSLGFNM